MNLSGAGVVKTTDNKDQAQQLLEWLATDGQDDVRRRQPRVPGQPRRRSPTTVVAAFGEFKPMPIDAEAYGALNAEAVDLLAEAGYK